MFVQVIQARTTDPQGLKKQSERWDEEVKPGAKGFLGSTVGVTEDGQFFAAARFESKEAARANSDRPEQSQWWEETSQYLEGPKFLDYTNVKVNMGGGSDDAGFVQAMQGRTTDLERAQQLDSEFEKIASNARPDLIGGFTCWQDDGTFTAVNYFSSEEEARKAEKQDPPAEFQDALQEWQSLYEDMSYIDLKEPWYSSP